MKKTLTLIAAAAILGGCGTATDSAATSTFEAGGCFLDAGLDPVYDDKTGSILAFASPGDIDVDTTMDLAACLGFDPRVDGAKAVDDDTYIFGAGDSFLMVLKLESGRLGFSYAPKELEPKENRAR